MKKITLLTLFFSILFWQSHGQDTCSAAISLTPGVAQAGDTTGNSPGSFSDSNTAPEVNPCSGSYNDQEYWFEYTATETGETLDILVTDLTSNYYGVFVIDNCPDSSPNCIASEINGFSSADLSVTTPGLTAGTTYYIVMSDWIEGSTTFTMNTVVNPAPTCFVPESLTSSNTDTTADFSWLASTGGETTWEYALLLATESEPTSGTTITTTSYSATNLTAATDYIFWLRSVCAVGDESEWISTAFTTTAGPPPANDECNNAIELTVNSDLSCANATAATTVDATASPQPDNATGTPNNDVWFSFVATDSSNQISLLNVIAVVGSSTDMGMSVFDDLAGCNMIEANEVGESDPNTLLLSGLVTGNTYYIRVYGWGSTNSAQANFDICLGTPPPPSTNTSCANAETISCGQTIYNDSSASTGTSEGIGCTMGDNGLWYTFIGTGFDVILTSTASFDHEIAIASGSCGALTNVSCRDLSTGTETFSFTTTLNETYYVYLAHWSSGNTTTGTIDLSLECAGTSNDYCSNATAITFGNEISDNNTGATDSGLTTDCFTGNIRDVWYSIDADATGAIYVNDLTAGFQYGIYSNCTGTQVGNCNEPATGLTEGETYYIRVNDDGTGNSRILGAFSFTPSTTALSANDFDFETGFSYYPNPVKNTLTLNAQQNIDTVTIYNMLGQEVLRLSPDNVDTTVDMSNLNTGAYFATVSILDKTETIRIIKQ